MLSGIPDNSTEYPHICFMNRITDSTNLLIIYEVEVRSGGFLDV